MRRRATSAGWVACTLAALALLTVAASCEKQKSRIDAGPPDVGVDIRPDGLEAGPPDAPAPDLPEPDLGPPDTGPDRGKPGVDAITYFDLKKTHDLIAPDIGVPKTLGCGVTTIAGGHKPGAYDGFRQLARFDNPVNVQHLPGGDLIIADYENNRLRRLTPNGQVSTVAQLARPFGMALSKTGTLYVQTDRPSSGVANIEGALWQVDIATGKKTLLLDKSGRARGIEILADGRLVLSILDLHALYVYDPATKTFDLLAGQPGTKGYKDGFGGQVQFDTPYDLVVTSKNEIVVADMRNSRLRTVTFTGKVTTLAGSGQVGSADGAAMQASFKEPKGLALGANDTIYISETGGHRVRRLKNGQVTTLAGDGVAGYLDDADPKKARFYAIEGLDVDPAGKAIYLADGNQGDGADHHRVRRLGLGGCIP